MERSSSANSIYASSAYSTYEQHLRLDEMFYHCPGSRLFAEPIPEPITCPHCGQEVEIFTTEQSMTCYFCGGLVTRERRPSCFDWCKYARECAELIDKERSAQKHKAGTKDR